MTRARLAGCGLLSLLAGLGPALALEQNKIPLLLGTPGWVLPGAKPDMDFANGRYYGLTPGQMTTTRASTESEVCNGVLTTFAANQPAITPGCGLWVWEARTNSYLNNNAPATQTVTVVVGSTYSVSFYGTGTLTLSGACTQTMTGAAFPARTVYSCTALTTSLVETLTLLGGMQYPQTELNSNLPATVASAVKAADGTGGVISASGVYTVTGGTCTTAPTLNVTWDAGGLMTVNSVANAGSCSVLPPSPATLAYASGAATGWTGATVTLTPTDNSAKGFATGPILTSGSAATRAEPLVSFTTKSPAAASLYVKATPFVPTVSTSNRYFATYGGAAGVTLIRFSNGNAAYTAGGSGFSMGVSLSQAASAALAIGYGGGSENYSANQTTGTAANAATITAGGVVLGTFPGGGADCNCSLSRVAVFTSKLSQSALGALK